MTIDDIDIKEDSPEKVRFIEEHNIPEREYLSAAEINVIVAELKNLKTQLSRTFYREQFNVSENDVSGNFATFNLQHAPVENSLTVYVRGVALPPADVEVFEKTVNIVLQNVDFGVEPGDLVFIHYQSR